MYRIIQLSDCHLYADISKVGYGDINPYTSLRRLLQQAQQLRPDMLVLTGDLSSDHSLQSYQHMVELLRTTVAADVQIRVIPGNHDKPEYLEQLFAGTPDYEDIGSCRMHFLNSRYRGALGRVKPARLERLHRDIKTAETLRHLIFVHHHPVDSNSWMDRHEWVNRADFLQVLRQSSVAVSVFHGHIHSERTVRFGTHTIYACPSTCWQWQLTPEFQVATAASPGFRLIDATTDGQLHSRVARLAQWDILKVPR